MKRGLKSSLIVGGVLLAAAVPASAASTPAANNHGLFDVAAICDGAPTAVVATNGAAFWADGDRYVISSFTSTFTPDGGGEPQTFTKVNGKRQGSDTQISCTATEIVPGGTVELEVVGDLVR